MLLWVSIYLACGVVYGELFLTAYREEGWWSKRPLWRLWLGSVLMWPACIYGELRGRSR